MEPIDVLRPTFHELQQAINNYKNILKDSPALVSLFNQGQWFSYTRENFEISSSYVHAYPGVLGGQLVFLMIPSAYDNKDTPNIQDYVQLCPISLEDRSNRISSKTALARINRWHNNHAHWIPTQVDSEYGMFQAFNISSEDFEDEFVFISLGLLAAADVDSPDRADMIVGNGNLNAMVYDDFVKPVPPFGASAAASSFYLLSL